MSNSALRFGEYSTGEMGDVIYNCTWQWLKSSLNLVFYLAPGPPNVHVVLNEKVMRPQSFEQVGLPSTILLYDGAIHFTSFLVFHTEPTVSIGLKNVF